jgi:subtilisin family serine protease
MTCARRVRAVFWATAVVIGVAATWATPAERVLSDRSSAITVRGIVAWVDPPFGFGLEDGTVVELEVNASWDGLRGVADLVAGHRVSVIGRTFEVGGRPAIKAGGVRVAAPSGRIVPIGSPVCMPPRLTLSGMKTLAFQSPASGSTPGTFLAADTKEETEIEGVVVSVAEESFLLETDAAERFTVVVNEETEFKEIDGIEELDAGNLVRARGELEGTVLTASRVELREGGDGGGDGGESDDGVDFESTGLVTELLPPDSFAFSDQRVYRVDGLTEYDEPIVSYSGLEVGQYLEVKAVYEGGSVYRAVKIEYEGDDEQGQGYRVVEGNIAAVSAFDMTLTDDTLLLFTTTTQFNGDADRREELQPGWEVKAYVLFNSAGQLLALNVRAEDPAPSTTTDQEYEPHEAILVLADGVDPQTVASRHDAEVSGEVEAFGLLFRWQREIDDDLLAQLAADTDVVAVEPNFLFRDPESTRRRFVIVDLSPTNGEYTGQQAAIKHGVTKAHTISRGLGTVVAIMDNGVDYCHPLLQGHLLAGGLDLIDGDMAPWETSDGIDQDGDGEIDEAAGHGTFVASVVALAAPGARILPYRVLDDDGGGTAFSLASALADAIERGVDVINLSLAYRQRSMVVDLLLEEAASRGIVVVAAAGNDGSATLPFPAVDSHVLAVTALNADGGGLADFANRGVPAVLAAIGEDVYGALFGGEYGTSSGTSMAAPFAAAGAALVKSLDPSVSPDIVRQLLLQSGVVVTDGGWSGRSLDLAKATAVAQP